VKSGLPLGGVLWSQPWHAMHRRLLQNSVRQHSTVPGGNASSESWLARALTRAAPRLAA